MVCVYSSVCKKSSVGNQWGVNLTDFTIEGNYTGWSSGTANSQHGEKHQRIHVGCSYG